MDNAFANSANNKAFQNLICDEDEYKKIYITDKSQIKDQLLNVTKDKCLKISNLVFYSHGSKGSMKFGKSTISYEKDYYEIFANPQIKNAIQKPLEVVITGCEFGRECKGRLSMHNLEKALNSNDIKIIAPNSNSSNVTLLFKTSKTGSINGSDLIYQKKDSLEKWTFEGLSSGEAMSLAQSCSTDCKDYMRKINEIKKITSTGACEDKNYANIMQIYLTTVQQLAELCANVKVQPDWNIKTFLTHTQLQVSDIEYIDYTVNTFYEKIEEIKKSCNSQYTVKLYPYLHNKKQKLQILNEYKQDLPIIAKPAH